MTPCNHVIALYVDNSDELVELRESERAAHIARATAWRKDYAANLRMNYPGHPMQDEWDRRAALRDNEVLRFEADSSYGQFYLCAFCPECGAPNPPVEPVNLQASNSTQENKG